MAGMFISTAAGEFAVGVLAARSRPCGSAAARGLSGRIQSVIKASRESATAFWGR